MKTFFRGLRWLALSVLGLLVSIVLCWWLIPDQKLDTGARQLLATPPLPPPSKNAYFLLWGLKASPELDAHAVGQKIVAEHERLLAAKADLGDFRPARFFGDKPANIKPALQRCDFERQECLVAYQNAAIQIRQDVVTYASYIERYRSLRNYPQYSERAMNMTVASPFPEFSVALNIGSLLDGWIAVQVAAPATRKAALDELAADTNMWRRLLRDSDSLLSQMVFASILHRKYRLASEIMTAYPDVARKYPEQMARITAPLAYRDADFARTLAGEFRFGAMLYQDLAHSFDTLPANTPGDKAGRLLVKLGAYRTNASINQAYAAYAENAGLYAKSPKEILSASSAPKKTRTGINWWNPATYFYNPVGKLFASIEGPDHGKYAFRLYDLIAYSRMVELQRRIGEANVPPERIPTVLSNVGAGLMNPYTEQAFKFDAPTRTLSFAGHGERFLRNGRMQIELGRQ